MSILACALRNWPALLARASCGGEPSATDNVSTLTMYLLCAIASYQLQRRDVRSGGTPFVLPGGALIPGAASAVIVWLLSQATAREYLVTGGVIAVAAGYYVVTRRLR